MIITRLITEVIVLSIHRYHNLIYIYAQHSMVIHVYSVSIGSENNSIENITEYIVYMNATYTNVFK